MTDERVWLAPSGKITAVVILGRKYIEWEADPRDIGTPKRWSICTSSSSSDHATP